MGGWVGGWGVPKVATLSGPKLGCVYSRMYFNLF